MMILYFILIFVGCVVLVKEVDLVIFGYKKSH